jgi:hypothetical protein
MKLSQIPNWSAIGAEGLVDYMIEYKIEGVENDYSSSKIVYHIDDILDSYGYFLDICKTYNYKLN